MLVCVHACVYVGVHLRVRVCMCVRARVGSVSVCQNRPRFSGQIETPPPFPTGPSFANWKKKVDPEDPLDCLVFSTLARRLPPKD